jgi:hypothetical protein
MTTPPSNARASRHQRLPRKYRSARQSCASGSPNQRHAAHRRGGGRLFAASQVAGESWCSA